MHEPSDDIIAASSAAQRLIVWVVLVACLVVGTLAARAINAPQPPPAVVLAAAKRHPSEVEVCRALAARWKGGVEHQLRDDGDGQFAGRSRIDIVTDHYVYEVDWAHKWPEAIGQAKYYEHQWAEEHPRDPRKAGIVLLLVDPVREGHYCVRCRRVCEELGITLVTEVVR